MKEYDNECNCSHCGVWDPHGTAIHEEYCPLNK